MTREEAQKMLKECREKGFKNTFYTANQYNTAVDMAIKALMQQPCEDAISREAVIDAIDKWVKNERVLVTLPVGEVTPLFESIHDLPPVTARPTGYCKDCKYFEYDSVAKVDGIPLIVAHEICKRWGDGCKTREDGYCFLFEPRAERSDKA